MDSVTALSKSRSAVTVRVELPGPTTRSSIAWTRVWMSVWKSSTAWARVPEPFPPEPSLAVSTRPSASATVTFSGSSPSMLEATTLTIACTCSPSRSVPAEVSTSTDAVAGACSSAKTCFSGRARCTIAVSTPSIASMVLESSPSMARLKFVCSWASEVEMSALSRMP